MLNKFLMNIILLYREVKVKKSNETDDKNSAEIISGPPVQI